MAQTNEGYMTKIFQALSEFTNSIMSPYVKAGKDFVGQVAGCLTVIQILSGVLVCNKIRRKGDTEGVSGIPFVAQLLMSLAMLNYGRLINDDIIQQVSLEIVVLTGIYCFVYYLYAQDKWDEFGKFFVPAMILEIFLWAYASWEDLSLVEHRYGILMTVLEPILLAAPILNMYKIITTGSSTYTSLVWSAYKILVPLNWFMYGLVIKNYFIIVQSVLGYIVCFLEMTLIAIYYSNN